MCFYAMTYYKLHYACVSCRVSFKQHADPRRQHLCPNCAQPLICAGHDFAPPPRRDVRRWSVVAAVLREGLRYEGRSVCGCDKEPKYRPQTRAELRVRQIVAARDKLPLSETLSRPDPHPPYGLSPGQITDLRAWVQQWLDDLGLRLAEPYDDTD